MCTSPPLATISIIEHRHRHFVLTRAEYLNPLRDTAQATASQSLHKRIERYCKAGVPDIGFDSPIISYVWRM